MLDQNGPELHDDGSNIPTTISWFNLTLLLIGMNVLSVQLYYLVIVLARLDIT